MFEPVVFVPAPAHRSWNTGSDGNPRAPRELTELMRRRSNGLMQFLESVDSRLREDHFRLLPGIEALILPGDVARLAEVRGEGTIWRHRCVQQETRRSFRATTQPSKWHLLHLGQMGGNERPLAGDGVLVGVADGWIGEQNIHWADRVEVAAFDSFGQRVPATPIASSHGREVASLLLDPEVGVAPACHVKLASVLRQEDRSRRVWFGEPNQVAQGLDWLVRYISDGVSIKVINASFGVEPSTSVEEIIKSITTAGVLLVAAAGNLGGQNLAYPARLEEALAVGAFDAMNQVLAETPHIGDKPEIWAPGGAVSVLNSLGSYSPRSGSSLASAIVSGAVAVLVGRDHSAKRDDLLDMLFNCPSTLPGGERVVCVP